MDERMIIGHQTQTGRAGSAVASANEPGANKLMMGRVAKDETANRQQPIKDATISIQNLDIWRLFADFSCGNSTMSSGVFIGTSINGFIGSDGEAHDL